MALSNEEELNELRSELARTRTELVNLAKEFKSARVTSALNSAIIAADDTDEALAVRAEAAGYWSLEQQEAYCREMAELRAELAEAKRARTQRPPVPSAPRGHVVTFEPPSRVKPVRRAQETYGNLRDRIFAAVVESNGLTKPQLQRMFYPGKKNRTALASHLGILKAEGRVVIEKGAFNPETQRPCDMVRPAKAQRVAVRAVRR